MSCSLLTRCTVPCAGHAKRHLNVQKWSVPVSFCTFDLERCLAPQRRALFRHLNFQKCFEGGVLCTFWLRNVLRATTACTFRHLNFQKCFDIEMFRAFWLRNLLRATPACTFDSSTLQKWSQNGVFCTFWVGNMLRATTACKFSSLIWPHGSAPAALASLLFDPPQPQIIGKTQWIVTFLPFRAPASSFFSLFLFSDLLSSALLFSDSSHLYFSICPYCQKFDF